MITQGSQLWQYLSPNQRILAGDGAFLLADSDHHRDEEPTDYSYVVFPFAKLYEGFLKQFLLDLGIISARDYASDHFRIGKVMSPNLVKRLGGRSAYGQLSHRFGQSLALKLWQAWKEGRNIVFHYFPHNYRALSRDRAKECIGILVTAMTAAIEQTGVAPRERDV